MRSATYHDANFCMEDYAKFRIWISDGAWQWLSNHEQCGHACQSFQKCKMFRTEQILKLTFIPFKNTLIVNFSPPFSWMYPWCPWWLYGSLCFQMVRIQCIHCNGYPSMNNKYVVMSMWDTKHKQEQLFIVIQVKPKILWVLISMMHTNYILGDSF